MLNFMVQQTEEKLYDLARYGSIGKENWGMLSSYQTLSEAFIQEFQDKVDWRAISIHQRLSEDLIREFQDKVDWGAIVVNQPLSEALMEQFQDRLDWNLACSYQGLSEPFIRKLQDRLDWYVVSKHQVLSENFIQEFQDKVDWRMISIHQPLSTRFILKHKNRVVWDTISKFQKLPWARSEMAHCPINWESVQDNWLNKDDEFKKQAIQQTGLYECHDDYFIAYKGIRSDRYSSYNFRYQYFPGHTYESFADGSAQINSFGLSVWTKDAATAYCDELVVTCKVNYADVARVVRHGKVRCSKITILD